MTRGSDSAGRKPSQSSPTDASPGSLPEYPFRAGAAPETCQPMCPSTSAATKFMLTYFQLRQDSMISAALAAFMNPNTPRNERSCSASCATVPCQRMTAAAFTPLSSDVMTGPDSVR